LNEKRKEEQVRLRIEQMLKQMSQLPELDSAALMEKIDKKIAGLVRNFIICALHTTPNIDFQARAFRKPPVILARPGFI
jgi:histidinol-phosphate/aromatic aminotransferase/cobyric acid decarboxylase-like protein